MIAFVGWKEVTIEHNLTSRSKKRYGRLRGGVTFSRFFPVRVSFFEAGSVPVDSAVHAATSTGALFDSTMILRKLSSRTVSCHRSSSCGRSGSIRRAVNRPRGYETRGTIDPIQSSLERTMQVPRDGSFVTVVV